MEKRGDKNKKIRGSKKLLFFVFFGLFCFGSTALASVSYSRSPSGINILSPVTFNVTFDGIEDFGSCGSGGEIWFICLDTNTEGATACMEYEDAISISDLSESFVVSSFFDASYYGVQATCLTSEYVLVDSIYLEGNGSEIVFNLGVEEEEEEFTFINISTDFVGGALQYVGQAVSGLGPFLYFIIGIPLAFWVLWKVSKLTPKK